MLQPLCTHGSEAGISQGSISQPEQWQILQCSRNGILGKEHGVCHRPPPSTYSGWEVTAGFKFLQQTGQDKGGEEEDAAPEEDVGRVGAVVSTGRSMELPVQGATFLEKQSMGTRRKIGITGGEGC